MNPTPRTRPSLGRLCRAALAAVLVIACTGLTGPQASIGAEPDHPEAFQVGPDRVADLPGGKEADGIIGDFVLRNDRIEAVIGNGRPDRKPNLFVFYDGTATPGCLYDLTLRGRNNDQLTFFAPSNLRGEVSHVRLLKDGTDGEAAVEVYASAALRNGVALRHEYRLRNGWPGLLIVTTVRNESAAAVTFDTTDRWSPLVQVTRFRGYTVGDAVDPADRAGYAFRWLEAGGFVAPPEEVRLAPGAEITFARGLSVGESPAAALGGLAQFLEGTSMVRGKIRDDQGRAVGTARLEIGRPDLGTVTAYPDARGEVSFPFPLGLYDVRLSDTGRGSQAFPLLVEAGQENAMDIQVGPVSRMTFQIGDGAGRDIPCKVQFLGTNWTSSPNLGPANRAHGCFDQYHSAHGRFTVAVPPGDYHVIVTHGPEFSHLALPVHVEPGATVPVTGQLQRLVDTRGWISTDFHSHSTESGDNTTGTDDRLISLAAENIEFAPATEHNRIYDWLPHVQRLGLTNEITTVSGIELTGPGAHFNAFPFDPVPRTRNNGGPDWNKDPRVNALLLRDWQSPEPARWVQINHPDMIRNWVDRDDDGRADGGFPGLTALIDGAETWGLGILAGAPYQLARAANGRDTVAVQREFVWLQLLNQGHRLACVAVSDAHSIHGSGVGGWRTYIRSGTDDPARIDWKEIVRNAKAGRSFVTTGPFLEVTTEDGTGPGGFTRAHAGVRLHVRVQCTDWQRIDRVQVLVNGRPLPRSNFTRATHPDHFRDGVVQFEREIGVPLSEDAHLIVVAIGEQSDLRVGFGTSPQASWKPCAYQNPIFVDLDGQGWKPNGDTLGWDLPVRRVDPDEVREMLQQHAPRP